jgi:hypothetical protein
MDDIQGNGAEGSHNIFFILAGDISTSQIFELE